MWCFAGTTTALALIFAFGNLPSVRKYAPALQRVFGELFLFLMLAIFAAGTAL